MPDSHHHFHKYLESTTFRVKECLSLHVLQGPPQKVTQPNLLLHINVNTNLVEKYAPFDINATATENEKDYANIWVFSLVFQKLFLF